MGRFEIVAQVVKASPSLPSTRVEPFNQNKLHLTLP